MSPISVAVPRGLPHHVEWRIVQNDFDAGAKFQLRCTSCDARWFPVGFDWVGPGPLLADVLKRLARERSKFEGVDDPCPAHGEAVPPGAVLRGD